MFDATETALFSDLPTNTGRQIEMDIAKSLAILAMVFVHVLLFIPNGVDTESAYGLIVGFFGGVPAAPVFMFCMGVGMVYSRHSQFASLFRRGLRLLFLAYLLNFLRGTLPLTVLSPWIDADAPFFQGESLRMKWLSMLFAVDILHFAGLTFLFFAIVRYFKLNKASLFVVGLALALVELLIVPHTTKSTVMNEFIGLFFRVDRNSAFPFFSWIPFPIAGYLFGGLLRKCRNKNSFYAFLLAAGSLLFILFTVTALKYQVPLGMRDDDVYYAQDFYRVLWGVSFILPWLSLLYFLSFCIPEGFLPDTIKRWSRNVNGIYMVHWVIIGWLVAVGFCVYNCSTFNTK